MRKIKNIFLDVPGFSCFGCAPQNAAGLKLEFYFDDKERVLVSQLREDSLHYQGFPGVLHGGIQATMMDECGFWVIYDQLKKFGFTLSMSIDYKNIVRLPDDLTIKTWVKENNEKTVKVGGKIITGSGETASEAEMTFFIATKKMWQQITGNEEIPKIFLSYL